MGMDLSYYEALMGGPAEELSRGGTGGVWVVSPECALDDAMLRLIGKARVVADSLGAYVYMLLAGQSCTDNAQPAVHAGADFILLASGVPSAAELADFFRPRAPQVVLFPRTRLGRVLGPALAQLLDGALSGYAADLTVDPASQRVVAHQPILNDEARSAVALAGSPAVAVVETALLPASFSEQWRTGQIEDTGIIWAVPPEYPSIELPEAPVTIATAPVVVAAGIGLRDPEGFALAERLAEALGGVVGGDVTALDAGWIDETQLVGITGHRIKPRLYLALGISGDTTHLMALQECGTIVAVQPDRSAPIAEIADRNIFADPAPFARALLAKLGKG